MANQDSTDSAKLDLASIDDEQFESLVAAIFSAKILRPAADENPPPDSLNHTVVEVSHTGRGPDEGKDLMLTTLVSDCVITRPFKWLVQCKHKAKSKRSVQLTDFKDGSFVDVVRQHGADGYLLVCSTRPARNLHSRFEALTADSSNPYPFIIWDGTRVCKEAHRHPKVIELFFPAYYRSHFQRDIEFEDVVGWIKRNKVSSGERSILSEALSEVVSPDDVSDTEHEYGKEQQR